MLGLKKAKKAKADEAAASKESEGDGSSSVFKQDDNTGDEKSSGGIKILGIGGKGIKKSGSSTKKRSPGEIRVQKVCYYVCLFYNVYLF